jgi:lipopolysaccharide transport system permease protein
MNIEMPMAEKENSGAPGFRIAPTQGWVGLRLGELWQYRELLYFFIWRDIKIRYKQTALGALWAIFQPLLTVAIFSLFLGRLAGVPSDGIPYPLFSFAALVPWTFFSGSLSLASNTMVNSADMIKKIYFPRLAMPIATVLSGGIDLLLAFAVFLGMMAWYGWAPTFNILWLPAFMLLAVIASTGVSLWLSSLCVRYRDVRHALPFLIQIWFFATPVVYPASLLPERWRPLYGLNPMVGVVEGFRWALLGSRSAIGITEALSSLVAIFILLSGLLYFRRMERTFADVV